MNNVETSNASISKICPDLITYFGSAIRPNMFNLALLHAAARANRVFIRGEKVRCLERKASEDPMTFYRRLLQEDGRAMTLPKMDELQQPVLAVLHDGDLSLPMSSDCYALFRDMATTSLAAADMI